MFFHPDSDSGFSPLWHTHCRTQLEGSRLKCANYNGMHFSTLKLQFLAHNNIKYFLHNIGTTLLLNIDPLKIFIVTVTTQNQQVMGHRSAIPLSLLTKWWPATPRWKNFTQTHSLLRLPDCQKDLTCENWRTDLMILIWWGAMRGLLSLSMASIIALQARSRRAYSPPKHPAAAAYYHSLRSCI